MINTIISIAITLLLAGCVTNKLQPAIYSKSDVMDVESTTVALSQPISHLSIDHSSASQDPAFLMQTISNWVKNKKTKKLKKRCHYLIRLKIESILRSLLSITYAIL